MKILELCGAAALAMPLFLHEVKREKMGEAGEEEATRGKKAVRGGSGAVRK